MAAPHAAPPQRAVRLSGTWATGFSARESGPRGPRGPRAGVRRCPAHWLGGPRWRSGRFRRLGALLPAELRSTDRSSVAVETGAPELRRCILGAPRPPSRVQGASPAVPRTPTPCLAPTGRPPGASPAARVCPGLPPRVPAERRLTPPPPAPSARPCHRVSAAGESPAGTVPDRKGDVLPDLPRERRRGTPDGRAGSAFELAATFLSAGRPGTNAGGRG